MIAFAVSTNLEKLCMPKNTWPGAPSMMGHHHYCDHVVHPAYFYHIVCLIPCRQFHLWKSFKKKCVAFNQNKVADLLMYP